MEPVPPLGGGVHQTLQRQELHRDTHRPVSVSPMHYIYIYILHFHDIGIGIFHLRCVTKDIIIHIIDCFRLHHLLGSQTSEYACLPNSCIMNQNVVLPDCFPNTLSLCITLIHADSCTSHSSRLSTIATFDPFPGAVLLTPPILSHFTMSWPPASLPPHINARPSLDPTLSSPSPSPPLIPPVTSFSLSPPFLLLSTSAPPGENGGRTG